MRKVRVDQLEAGMVLAADVEDLNGKKMLSEGTVITEKQLTLLTSRHVFEVLVEDAKASKEDVEAVEAADSAEDAALEAAKERLAASFEGCKPNEWMERLHKEAEKRLSVPRFWRAGL